ncbi:MAG: FemAB family XrtA/PEP-CTERM system-associated protein [Gemmatimonadaceae bacterium]
MRAERFSGAPAEWDTCVRACPGWTHFHLHGWRTVIERALGHECIYLAARRPSGELEGVLPLVRVRSHLFGHYLVSQPFLNYGGPLGSDDAVRALAAAAVDIARGDRVKLLELRSRRQLPVDLPVSHRKITVVLDLPNGDSAAAWKRLDAKVRSQVRRPQKEGVTVRFGADQVAPFFSVFSRHMRDLGTPTQSRRLFDTVAETFGDDVWFGCAYLDGQAIAGGCAFRWGDEMEMTWASSLVSHKRLAPNMLLYWSFMERASNAGITTFNFGRCSPESGAHRFKMQWGSRDEPLWWYTHSANGVVATPTPDRGAYAWGARMWRHLPIQVATAMGPRIVRCIP